MPPGATDPGLQAVSKPDSLQKSSHNMREFRTLSPSIKGEDNDSEVKEALKADEVSSLASIFKADLSNIRNLVTCSICDQLLYEPFTIQCGHTYCYSCLCSWFTPNKSNKTCPECRTAVKQTPAPSFMIKQLVEIFTKRLELMQADESVDQHTIKRAEEVAAVEEDRNSERGLFKGLFSARTPLLDEADGVHRCPTCQTEYIGGPACATCGTEIDGDSFDFSDDFDLDGLDEDHDHDLEAELELEFGEGGHQHIPARYLVHGSQFRSFRFGGRRDRNHESTPSVTSDSDDSRDLDANRETDSEDEGSIQDFIVNDDSPERLRYSSPQPRPARRRSIHQSISSDDSEDSDEDVIQRGRANRFGRQSSPRRSQHIDSVEDDDNSDDDSIVVASVRLRDAGWSPLHGNDNEEPGTRGSDKGQSDASDISNDLTTTTDDDSDDSDTETMLGHDDIPRRRIVPPNRTRDFWEDGVYGAEMSGNTDHEGDTEMSLSPVGHGIYGGDYGDYPDSESNPGRLTTEECEESFHRDSYGFDGAQDFGETHHIHEELEEESDDSPAPPVRRRPRSLRFDRGRGNNSGFTQMSMAYQSHQESSNNEDENNNRIEDFETVLYDPSEDRHVDSYPQVNIITHASGPSRIRADASSHFPATAPRVGGRPHRVERRYHAEVRRQRIFGYRS